MTKSKGAVATSRPHVARHGEGHSVDLTVISEKDGYLQTSLDLSAVPVPDRRFSADAADLRRESSMVKLLLAQREPVGTGYLSMVVICLTFEAIAQFVNSIHAEFDEAYRRLQEKIPTERLTHFDEPARQSVVLNGSVVMAGYSGTQGCIDFYYASPFSMQQISIYKKVNLEPIVRVNLPSSLLFAIIEGLIELRKAGDFPSLDE
jgi:hypothetical protein